MILKACCEWIEGTAFALSAITRLQGTTLDSSNMILVARSEWTEETAFALQTATRLEEAIQDSDITIMTVGSFGPR